MDYKATIDYLFEQLPMFQRVGPTAFKKDLSKTIQLLEALENPHHQFKSIHIAGTNGKGSVTHILAAALQQKYNKVACYTSPHYVDFRERIKINGQPVGENYVVSFVKKHKSLIEKIQPSFFEITVAMAFDYFAQEEVDFAIIETGMGGRLDSTNVITPILSIITNISYDHQQFLGETLPEIAGEKAGIIKENIPVIIGEYQEEIAHVFEEKASAMHAECFFAKDIVQISQFQLEDKLSRFELIWNKRKWNGTTDLLGQFQEQNITTSLAALIHLMPQLDIHFEDILKALENVRQSTYFLGRCMLLSSKPIVIADSAHNEAGLSQLLSFIKQFDFNHLHIVYGTVADKQLDKIIDLMPKKATYYWCNANIPRALDAEKLQKQLQPLGFMGKTYESVEKAYLSALAACHVNDLVVICGSIFVVAEIPNLTHFN